MTKEDKPTYEELEKEVLQLKKIIELKNNEIKENLINSKLAMHSILNASNELLFLIDTEGKLLVANKATAKYLGLELDEILGKIVFDYIHPDIAAFRKQKIAETIQSKESIQFEDKENNKWIMNSIYPIIKENKVISLAIYAIDITERKKMEEALKENEEIWNHFMLNSPIYVFFKDDEIRSLRLSKNYEQMLNMPMKNLLGKNMFDLFPSELAKKMIEDDKRILNENQEINIEEKLNDRFYNTIKFPFTSSNNKKYLAGFTIDITEKKQAELELISAKEKAENSDRLKTIFLQNISHEIRTPMNAIIGFADLLKQPELSIENKNKYIEIISNSSHQLLSVISDILTISNIETKQEKNNLENISVNLIFEELFAIFNPKAQTITLLKNTPSGSAILYTDKTKLKQIISNLLNNALKFTQKGFIEFGYTLEKEFIKFHVKDTGIGIKPEYHKTIFERFRQADSNIQKNYGGSGLGLSISKALVELLGGKIWLESELEKGTTFYFTIPFIPIKNNTIQEENHLSKETSKAVLIAEDK